MCERTVKRDTIYARRNLSSTHILSQQEICPYIELSRFPFSSSQYEQIENGEVSIKQSQIGGKSESMYME